MRRDAESALALYERELLRQNYAPESVRVLVATARGFVAGLERRIGKTTVQDLEAHLARRASALSARTHASELSRLRTFFRALREVGLLKTDPAEGVTVREPDSVPQLPLSEETVAQLLVGASAGTARRRRPPEVHEAIRLRDRACLELLYGLGLRASEARAALVLDLRLGDGTLVVRRAKRGKPAELPLPPRALAHIERYLVVGRPVLSAPGRDQGRLLLTATGRPLNRSAIGDLLRRLQARLGIRSHPHAYRRAVATHMVRDGVSVLAVRELLGHASLSTTATYTEVQLDDLRRAIDQLSPDAP